MTALNALSDNVNISVLSMLASQLFFLILFELFLVIWMISDIQLKAVIFILCSEIYDLI